MSEPALLQADFEKQRDAEYARFRSQQGIVRISPWTPRLTTAWDELRTVELQKHMQVWSTHWWTSRGFFVRVIDTERFEVTPRGEVSDNE